MEIGRSKRWMTRVLVALLGVAMVFTLAPVGSPSYAEETDPVAFTLVDTDGTTTEFTLSQMKAFSHVDEDYQITYKGETVTINKGISVKSFLKAYKDKGTATVTVSTADNYTGTIDASGKTVDFLRNNDYILAYQVNGKGEFVPDGNKTYGYFHLYGKDEDGNYTRAKWVDKFVLSDNGGTGGDDPVITVPDLTVTGSALKETKEFSIKDLKKDIQIDRHTDVEYPSTNSKGKFETSIVSGVYMEDLINYIGIKSGMKVTKVTAIPYKSDGTEDTAYIMEYTWKDLTTVDIYGNKAMFIWAELEQADREAGVTTPNKVQRTIRGKFSEDDVNRSSWGKNIKKIIVEGETEATTTPTTKPTTKPATVTLGKSKVWTRATSGKRMTANWTKVKNATSYQLAWRKAGSTWKTTSVKGTRKILTGMKYQGLYEFKVAPKAVSKGKTINGKYSAIEYRYYKVSKKVNAKGVNRNIQVTWQKDGNSNGYQVLCSTNRNMKGSKIFTVPGKSKTSYKITGLKKGTTYYVSVRPYKTWKSHRYIGVRTVPKVIKIK